MLVLEIIGAGQFTVQRICHLCTVNEGMHKKTELSNYDGTKGALKNANCHLIAYVGTRRGQLSRKWRWILPDLLLQKYIPLVLVISLVRNLGVDC